jgi:3-phosphoshikimate 1-carboxyvinyltransferase
MNVIIESHPFFQTVRIPASKSHTIRQLLIAAFAEGVSRITAPLDSLDTRSCIAVCRALGAQITEEAGGLSIRGTGGAAGVTVPARTLDAGNSGTTLFLALAMASLASSPVSFTGDEQIARRSAAPELDALAALGVRVSSNGGCVPVTVQGPWRGGRISLRCPTSQYLSALLLAAPLAAAATEIDVPLLNEKPYIALTLSCLDAQGVVYEKAEDLSFFSIPGGGAYRATRGAVPADFSSAAFPACAAVAGGGPVTLLGLDPRDAQGDKVYFDYLKTMGCAVEWAEARAGEWTVTVSRPGALRGGEFDLNATPDMLPAMAVSAAYATGETALVNVANARIKETDRIAGMAAELSKLRVDIRERPDGLIITGRSGGLSGGSIAGQGDHRIVMALAAGALGAAGTVTIDSAESAAVTWPGFLELLDAEFAE